MGNNSVKRTSLGKKNASSEYTLSVGNKFRYILMKNVEVHVVSSTSIVICGQHNGHVSDRATPK